jgi:2'-5' RNA ligase
VSSKRLFFALWPAEQQRERLHDAIDPVVGLVDGSPVHRGNWHVTLVFIGKFSERLIPELQADAATIAVEPFRLCFDRLEFWKRPKAACLVAGTVPPELRRLVTSLNNMVADFGVRIEKRQFLPHITVVRGARFFEQQRLAQTAATEWSDFELIDSVSQPGGSTYRPLKQ